MELLFEGFTFLLLCFLITGPYMGSFKPNPLYPSPYPFSVSFRRTFSPSLPVNFFLVFIFIDFLKILVHTDF